MAAILCIDDDPKMLQMHKALLESHGHWVITACDGSSGIAITRRQPVDLVVLDFHMPGMTGGQVAELLVKENEHLPCVICSGNTDDIPLRQKCIVYGVLSKGDGPQSLLTMVDQLVANESMERRRHH